MPYVIDDVMKIKLAMDLGHAGLCLVCAVAEFNIGYIGEVC